MRSRVLLLGLVGCWSAPPVAAPLHNTAPPSAPPALPAPLATEFGTFDDDGFAPSAEVPLKPGSAFGWRLQLDCAAPASVPVREELRLPAPGDWGMELEISDDGRIARIRSTVPCVDGWIEKVWSVSPGDPPGMWTFRVTAEGYATHTFRASFR